MVAIHVLFIVMLILPLIGALFVVLIRGEEEVVARNARMVTIWISSFTFLVSCYLAFSFHAGIGTSQHQIWLTPFAHGLSYGIGMDGISLVFVLLTTFIMPFCILAGWSSITKNVKGYLAAFLILETLLLLVFVAQDLVLFYLAFEGSLVPMFIIIGVWGGKNRVYASLKFFLYTFAGSVFMLAAILVLYHELHSTSFSVIASSISTLPVDLRRWLFLAFFVAMAIKIPMWPVHTWLPDAHVEAPTAGSMVLAAILLKMGAYGFLRFSLPFFPEASKFFEPLIFTLSIIAILYAAWAALAQTDMKKLVAYSSISHMGFVTMGIFSGTLQGINGAIFIMISHGLISAALFFCVGVVYDRTHTRDIAAYGGVVKTMPIYAFFFMLFTMANIALPGTSGFIGEFTTIVGTFLTHPLVALLSALGVIFSAVYALHLYRRVVFGVIKNDAIKTLKDLTPREKFIFIPLAAGVLFFGFYPAPVFKLIEAPVSLLHSAPTVSFAPRHLAQNIVRTPTYIAHKESLQKPLDFITQSPAPLFLSGSPHEIILTPHHKGKTAV